MPPHFQSNSTFLTPVQAFLQFCNEELLEQMGCFVAKSTVYDAFMQWAAEAPGRPALSPKHLGMLIKQKYPKVSSKQASKSVEFVKHGHWVLDRPMVWIGLRMMYPIAGDPFEIEFQEMEAQVLVAQAALAAMSRAERAVHERELVEDYLLPLPGEENPDPYSSGSYADWHNFKESSPRKRERTRKSNPEWVAAMERVWENGQRFD